MLTNEEKGNLNHWITDSDSEDAINNVYNKQQKNSASTIIYHTGSAITKSGSQLTGSSGSYTQKCNNARETIPRVIPSLQKFRDMPRNNDQHIIESSHHMERNLRQISPTMSLQSVNEIQSFRSNLPRNFERQLYSDTRSLDHHRETSPVSLRSIGHNYPYHSQVNGRTSPVSCISDAQSFRSNMSAIDIVSVLKTVQLSRNEKMMIEKALKENGRQKKFNNDYAKRKKGFNEYNHIKLSIRKRQEKDKKRKQKESRKLFCKESDDDSGDQGSVSSISSNDYQSIINKQPLHDRTGDTGLSVKNIDYDSQSSRSNTTNMSQAIKNRTTYTDSTAILKQHAIKGMFNLEHHSNSGFNNNKRFTFDKSLASMAIHEERFHKNSVSKPDCDAISLTSAPPIQNKLNRITSSYAKSERNMNTACLFSSKGKTLLSQTISNRNNNACTNKTKVHKPPIFRNIFNLGSHILAKNGSSTLANVPIAEKKSEHTSNNNIEKTTPLEAQKEARVEMEMESRKQSPEKIISHSKIKVIADIVLPHKIICKEGSTGHAICSSLENKDNDFVFVKPKLPQISASKNVKNSVISHDLSEKQTTVEDQSDSSLLTKSSFMRRKLFTHTLDLLENKHNNDINLTPDSPLTNVYGASLGNKIRKSHFRRSYLSRNINDDSKSNKENILELVQKIISPEDINLIQSRSNKTLPTDKSASGEHKAVDDAALNEYLSNEDLNMNNVANFAKESNVNVTNNVDEDTNNNKDYDSSVGDTYSNDDIIFPANSKFYTMNKNYYTKNIYNQPKKETKVIEKKQNGLIPKVILQKMNTFLVSGKQKMKPSTNITARVNNFWKTDDESDTSIDTDIYDKSAGNHDDSDSEIQNIRRSSRKSCGKSQNNNCKHCAGSNDAEPIKAITKTKQVQQNSKKKNGHKNAAMRKSKDLNTPVGKKYQNNRHKLLESSFDTSIDEFECPNKKKLSQSKTPNNNFKYFTKSSDGNMKLNQNFQKHNPKHNNNTIKKQVVTKSQPNNNETSNKKNNVNVQSKVIKEDLKMRDKPVDTMHEAFTKKTNKMSITYADQYIINTTPILNDKRRRKDSSRYLSSRNDSSRYLTRSCSRSINQEDSSVELSIEKSLRKVKEDDHQGSRKSKQTGLKHSKIPIKTLMDKEKCSDYPSSTNKRKFAQVDDNLPKKTDKNPRNLSNETVKHPDYSSLNKKRKIEHVDNSGKATRLSTRCKNRLNETENSFNSSSKKRKIENKVKDDLIKKQMAPVKVGSNLGFANATIGVTRRHCTRNNIVKATEDDAKSMTISIASTSVLSISRKPRFLHVR